MSNGGGGAATPAAGLSSASWRLAQMGKASRWLRNLFLPLPGWKSRKAKDRGTDADCQSVRSAPLPSHSQAAAPSGRERRRWSFRRPGAGASGGTQGQCPLASSSSHCFSEAEVHVVVVAQEQDQDQQKQQLAANTAAVVIPEAASSTAGAVVVPVLASSGRRSGAGAGGRDAEAAAAAVKIQAAFRSYLASKALCALRGMVKLQAMVRGQLVRRQANLTLRRMQALVHAQRRARAERLRLLEVEDGASSRHQITATPRPPPNRRSPQHPRSRKAPEAVERGSEENDVRIVEVDDGAPRAATRRNSSSCHHYSTSTTMPSRITPAKAEDPCQKVSLTTPSSARTDASARTPSGRFDADDASFASASAPTPVQPSRRTAWRADPPFCPSYMANTESSRAKARSQSAPRQRLSSASETSALVVTAASPSPSCCERTPSRGGGGGSARRRVSLDPMDLPGGGTPSSRRMERCASRVRASTTMSSVPGSECESSSTVGYRDSARTGHGHGMGGYY